MIVLKEEKAPIFQGEHNAKHLLVHVEPEILEDNGAVLEFVRADGETRVSDLLTFGEDNVARYALASDLTEEYGTLTAQIVIQDGDGGIIIKSRIFGFDVLRSNDKRPVDVGEQLSLAILAERIRQIDVAGTVRFDREQALTDEERRQALENISAAPAGRYVEKPGTTVPSGYTPTSDGTGGYEWTPAESGDDAVKYTVQSKSAAEKTQARANIGAVDSAAVSSAVSAGVSALDAELSAVAKSGSYSDLEDTPEIPSIEGLASEVYVDNAVRGKQNAYTVQTITLAAADWDSAELTQTVTVTGVTASNDIDVASDPSNFEEYGKTGIYAIAQATDSVTFKCKKIPETDLVAFVRIWG